VGEIHGRLHLLERPLWAICEDHEANPPSLEPAALIVFDDDIDRGRQSAGVIDRPVCDEWTPFRPRVLRGDNGTALLSFRNGQRLALPLFPSGGGEPAAEGIAAPSLPARARLAGNSRRSARGSSLRSCGAQTGRASAGPDRTRHAAHWRARLKGALPVPLHNCARSYPVDAAEAKHALIALDTGAFVTDRLSAVRLEGEEASFLNTRGVGVGKSGSKVSSGRLTATLKGWFRNGHED